ncbi:MAG TPA: helix-turn-helix transcriptional regulator [Acidimicrobiia bacterium]|nr:helix-turn-helix transcriptional regulator [Acidimicrobiia bacterium]
MASTFGTELRAWRDVRGLSQTELGARAGVSQRHISFLETGRSLPSHEMVLCLAGALGVPPREQNVLLALIGHAPEYPETPLHSLPAVRDALAFMTTAHEPNMAFAIDRRWDVVASNAPARRFMKWAFPVSPPWLTSPPNVMLMCLRPDGLRRLMVDWERPAAALLRCLERDAASLRNDEELRALITEVRAQPGCERLAIDRYVPGTREPVAQVAFVVEGEEISLFTTVAVLGDANDLTLSELRILTLWPADEESADRSSRYIG